MKIPSVHLPAPIGGKLAYLFFSLLIVIFPLKIQANTPILVMELPNSEPIENQEQVSLDFASVIKKITGRQPMSKAEIWKYLVGGSPLNGQMDNLDFLLQQAQKQRDIFWNQKGTEAMNATEKLVDIYHGIRLKTEASEKKWLAMKKLREMLVHCYYSSRKQEKLIQLFLDILSIDPDFQPDKSQLSPSMIKSLTISQKKYADSQKVVLEINSWTKEIELYLEGKKVGQPPIATPVLPGKYLLAYKYKQTWGLQRIITVFPKTARQQFWVEPKLEKALSIENGNPVQFPLDYGLAALNRLAMRKVALLYSFSKDKAGNTYLSAARLKTIGKDKKRVDLEPLGILKIERAGTNLPLLHKFGAYLLRKGNPPKGVIFAKNRWQIELKNMNKFFQLQIDSAIKREEQQKMGNYSLALSLGPALGWIDGPQDSNANQLYFQRGTALWLAISFQPAAGWWTLFNKFEISHFDNLRYENFQPSLPEAESDNRLASDFFSIIWAPGLYLVYPGGNRRLSPFCGLAGLVKYGRYNNGKISYRSQNRPELVKMADAGDFHRLQAGVEISAGIEYGWDNIFLGVIAEMQAIFSGGRSYFINLPVYMGIKF